MCDALLRVDITHHDAADLSAYAFLPAMLPPFLIFAEQLILERFITLSQLDHQFAQICLRQRTDRLGNAVCSRWLTLILCLVFFLILYLKKDSCHMFAEAAVIRIKTIAIHPADLPIVQLDFHMIFP